MMIMMYSIHDWSWRSIAQFCGTHSLYCNNCCLNMYESISDRDHTRVFKLSSFYSIAIKMHEHCIWVSLVPTCRYLTRSWVRDISFKFESISCVNNLIINQYSVCLFPFSVLLITISLRSTIYYIFSVVSPYTNWNSQSWYRKCVIAAFLYEMRKKLHEQLLGSVACRSHEC